MTREQWKLALPFAQAYAEGKELEWQTKSGGECWYPVTDGELFNVDDYNFRIKPEPKLRPWKPEEVPVGALFRWKDQPHDINLITAACLTRGGGDFAHGANWKALYKNALQMGEFSTDGGKTWLPCGVMEGAQ